MISGADLRRLFLLLGILAAAPAHAQSAWSLQQLMQSLAQTRNATAHFTERQTSPVLSAPLISVGILVYVAPNYLRKTTTAPAPEMFTLDHDQITLTSSTSGGTHVFTLNQDPRIAGLVEGIRATLAGDLPTLEQYYTVALSGDAENWQLLLQPKAAPLTHFLRAITITGAQGHIAAIDTATADGADSRMYIAAADAQ
jgi:outer membrane lipoprotein-sorting protein